MDTDDELYKASQVVTDTLMNTLTDSDEDLSYYNNGVSEDFDLDHLDTSIDDLTSGMYCLFIMPLYWIH